MASKSESGHAKNVTNFENLITRIESLGIKYNPSKNQLQLANLKLQHQTAAASLLTIAIKLPAYQQAVDAREAAFYSLNKLVTKSLNMFKALADSPAETDNANTLSKKIRGFKKYKSDEPNGVEPMKTASTSQQSYDMQTFNFRLFIEILAAHPAYQPNEDDLKIASLRAFLKDLEAKSQTVTLTQANLHTARSNRNALLYNKSTGLVDTGRGVKTYIKAAFTADSPNYKPILSLEFRRNKI